MIFITIIYINTAFVCYANDYLAFISKNQDSSGLPPIFPSVKLCLCIHLPLPFSKMIELNIIRGYIYEKELSA